MKAAAPAALVGLRPPSDAGRGGLPVWGKARYRRA